MKQDYLHSFVRKAYRGIKTKVTLKIKNYSSNSEIFFNSENEKIIYLGGATSVHHTGDDAVYWGKEELLSNFKNEIVESFNSNKECYHILCLESLSNILDNLDSCIEHYYDI